MSAPHADASGYRGHRLEFSKPAGYWEESLLLGNGHMGVSVWGGIGKNRFQLNHDTFWAGSGQTQEIRLDPDTLQTARMLIASGEYQKAEMMLEEAIPGLYTYPYQPMGDLNFQYSCMKPDAQASYRRSLDMAQALYQEQSLYGSSGHRMEGFVSHPSHIAVFRFSSLGEAFYSGELSYSSPYADWGRYGDCLDQGTHLIYSVKAPSRYDGFLDLSDPVFSGDGGITGFVSLRIVHADGECRIEDNSYILDGVREFLLFIRTETDWTGPVVSADDSDFLSLTERFYGVLKDEHLRDYTSHFSRTNLSLGADRTTATLPDRLIQSQGKNDPELVETLFHYGKYLLLSSSRPGSQPANLQGLWNRAVNPPWWSNYTMNINTEMNYWGACLSGMSSCAEPLFAYAKRLMVNGRKTAYDIYGCRGWCSHHQSDIWATTHARGKTNRGVENGNAEYSLWPFGGVWISLMAWHHYEFTENAGFLREVVHPLLEGSILFLKDFTLTDNDGNLTTSPSTSPENRFRLSGQHIAVSSGSTMDLTLVLEAADAYLSMGRLISCRKSLLEWSRMVEERVTPYKIGCLGQLQEWSVDWDREEDKHRHMSHLFGIYPGKSLMTSERRQFLKAAERSMDMRGVDATGWSFIWKIIIMARLQRPDKVSELMRFFMKPVSPEDQTVHFTGGGFYPNLLSAHPPFQIDANLGFIAAVAETIVQQIDHVIRILPALPEEWPEGYLNNYRGKGRLSISVKWRHGHLEYVKIKSVKNGSWTVEYQGKSAPVQLDYSGELCLDGNLNKVML